MKDLFLIELLKIKYPKIYKKIASKEYLLFKATTDTTTSSKGQQYDVNFEKILTNHYGGQKQNYSYNKLEELLRSLYSAEDGDINNYKSVIFLNKHETYYNYITTGLITDKEFRDLWDYDFPLIKKTVQDFFLNNKKEDFFKKVELFSPQIIDKEIFEKLIIVLTEFSQSMFQRRYIIDRIINWEKYKQNPDLIRERDSNSFIEKILNNQNINLVNRIYLCHDYLYEIIRSNPFTLPIFKSKFTEINIILFKTYLENCKKISYELFQVYYSIIADINNNNSFVLDQEANYLFKQFITKHSEDYLKILLRPLYSPPNERYVFEPFFKQTFKDENEENGFENFEKFINEFDGDTELKNFIKTQFEIYKNSDSEPKSITLNEAEIKYLNEIQAKFKTEH